MCSMESTLASTDDRHRRTAYRSVWRSLVDTDFQQGHVEALGLRTRYVRAGSRDRPPLVMLHGTGGHWETFCDNIPALAAHYDCIAFDMLGCGFTDKPDRPYEIKDYVEHALAFLDVLGVTKASIIGVSLGSWVACRLALDAPERVDKLILNASAGLLPLSQSVAASASNRRNLSANPSWDEIEGVLEHLFYDRSSLTDDIIAVRQQVYRLPGPGTRTKRNLTLFDPEVRQRNLITSEEWAAITAPTLIIAHVDSPDDYLKTAFAIATMMPNATLTEVHKVSHWPQFERPDVFNELAIEFLSHDESRN
jgi:2-hydroxy-6-oxonona-2,4-dienedioate hydrolase